MFSTEDKAALEAANRVVLDRLEKLQAEWNKEFFSNNRSRAFQIDQMIELEDKKNKVFTQIIAGHCVSQVELTLLLEDKDLIDYRKTILSCAKMKLVYPPEISGVALCVVTSLEQLRAIFQKPAKAAE